MTTFSSFYWEKNVCIIVSTVFRILTSLNNTGNPDLGGLKLEGAFLPSTLPDC